MATMQRSHAIDLLWLVRLRWGAVLGQIGVIALVHWGLGAPLNLKALFFLVAVEVLSNFLISLRTWGEAAAKYLVPGLLALDVLLLTGLLFFSGGPNNPFSPLYLVYIALAAVILPAAATWFLVTLSSLCFASLFWTSGILPNNAHAMHGDGMRMHLQGMWVAFATAVVFIVYFVQRISRALAKRESELNTARERSKESARLASLATLAAGAAHELGSPLSTIAVVAKELERQIAHGGDRDALLDDARLVRREVERCRTILNNMAADAGEEIDESSTLLALQEFLGQLNDNAAVTVNTGECAADAFVMAPKRRLEQVLRGLVNNALDAADGAPVNLNANTEGHRAIIHIADRGPGIPEDILRHVGEPFFTTKEPGKGMGLGVFLARTTVERLGGSVTIESEIGSGTEVRVELPLVEHRPRERP